MTNIVPLVRYGEGCDDGCIRVLDLAPLMDAWHFLVNIRIWTGAELSTYHCVYCEPDHWWAKSWLL